MTIPKSSKSGVSNSFSGGPNQLSGCLQRAEIILGLYKCNYSLTVKELNYIWLFEGNCEADVAPSENEFDTLVLTCHSVYCLGNTVFNLCCVC